MVSCADENGVMVVLNLCILPWPRYFFLTNLFRLSQSRWFVSVQFKDFRPRGLTLLRYISDVAPLEDILE